MTEPTRRRGGTNALACQVTIYRRESYVAVKIILKNVREQSVAVTYRQTVPDDIARDHLSFTSSYMGDAWTFEDATLEFATDIGPGEQVETVYGIKRVEVPALVDFINYGTIVVTQDGTTIETLTDIDPDIEGDPEGGETSTTQTDVTEAEASASDEPTAQSSETGDSPEEEPRGAETDEPSENSPQRESQQANGHTGAGAGADEPAESDAESIEWVTPTQADSADTASTTAEEAETPDTATEALDEPDAKAVTDAEQTDRGVSEGEGSAVGSDTERPHVPFSETQATSDGERTPALPANPEDYILEDVRGKIESAAEFEWVELAVDATDDEDGGVLGWVRSRLPF